MNTLGQRKEEIQLTIENFLDEKIKEKLFAAAAEAALA